MMIENTRVPSIVISPGSEEMFREIGKLEKGPRGFLLLHITFFKPFLRYLIRKESNIVKSTLMNTVTVTRIENPKRGSNQIPQSVSVHLNCRLLPGTNSERFIRRIERIMESKHIKIRQRTTVDDNYLYSSPDNIFFEALSDAVKAVYADVNVIPIIFPASNDNQYFRMKGINCYGLLPVYISEELLCSIHNANERIPIQALEDGTEVYTQFLRSVLPRPAVAEKNTAVNLQQSK